MIEIISAPLLNPSISQVPHILVGEMKFYPPDTTTSISVIEPTIVSYPVIAITLFEVGKEIDVLLETLFVSSLRELKYIRPTWPLYSLAAWGKWPAAGVWFQRFRGKTRIYKLPEYPYRRSPDQATRRNRFAAAVAAWQALDFPTRQLWHFDCWPHGKRMSGYNWFISNFMRETGYWPTP
ncbi:hypothetical protein ES707_08091 [subsurface metagenome]